MDVLEIIGDFLGLIFVLIFAGLMVIFTFAGRKKPSEDLRDIPAFVRLRRAVGLSVEAGTRLHVSLGSGGLTDLQGGIALAGLSALERSARAASISDCPPVSTSGDGLVTILSQDTLRSAFRAVGEENQYDPTNGRLAGFTPFAYAAGTIPIISDEQVSTNLLVGHFGAEVALLAEAGQRKNALTVGGSDSLPAQAVLYASAEEPLIGEEVYAGGAYLGAGPLHIASLRAQDILRWILVAAILIGALAKLGGLL